MVIPAHEVGRGRTIFDGMMMVRRRTMNSDRLRSPQHLLDPASGDPHQITVDLGADEPASFVDCCHCRWHGPGAKNQIATKIAWFCQSLDEQHRLVDRLLPL